MHAFTKLKKQIFGEKTGKTDRGLSGADDEEFASIANHSDSLDKRRLIDGLNLHQQSTHRRSMYGANGRQLNSEKENLMMNNNIMYSQVRKKPSPYDVMTEPKTRKSSRSCPGGYRDIDANSKRTNKKKTTSRYLPTLHELSDASYENFQNYSSGSFDRNLTTDSKENRKPNNRPALPPKNTIHGNQNMPYAKPHHTTSEYESGESFTPEHILAENLAAASYSRSKKDSNNRNKAGKYRSAPINEERQRSNVYKYHAPLSSIPDDEEPFPGDFDDDDSSTSDCNDDFLQQRINKLSKEAKYYKEASIKYRKRYQETKAIIEALRLQLHYEKEKNLNLMAIIDGTFSQSHNQLFNNGEIQMMAKIQQQKMMQLQNMNRSLQQPIPSQNAYYNNQTVMPNQQYLATMMNYQQQQTHGQGRNFEIPNSIPPPFSVGRIGAGEALASNSTIVSAGQSHQQPETSTPNVTNSKYQNLNTLTPTALQQFQQQTPYQSMVINQQQQQPLRAPPVAPLAMGSAEHQQQQNVIGSHNNPSLFAFNPQMDINNNGIVPDASFGGYVDEVRNFHDENPKLNTSEDSIELARRSSVSSNLLASPIIHQQGKPADLCQLIEDIEESDKDEEGNNGNGILTPANTAAITMSLSNMETAVNKEAASSARLDLILHNFVPYRTENSDTSSDTESSDSMVWIGGQLQAKPSKLPAVLSRKRNTENFEDESEGTHQAHLQRSLSDSALADRVISLDAVIEGKNPFTERKDQNESDALKWDAAAMLNNSSSDEATARILSKQVQHLRSSRVRFRPPRRQLQPDRAFKRPFGAKEREAIHSFHFLHEEATDISGLVSSEDPSEKENERPISPKMKEQKIKNHNNNNKLGQETHV